MEARKKRLLIYAGVITGITVVYLILTSQSSQAAAPTGAGVPAPPSPSPSPNQTPQPAQSSAQASQEFDNYINQAKVYANNKSGIVQKMLNAAISAAASNKTAIINEATSSGQSVSTYLSSLIPNI